MTCIGRLGVRMWTAAMLMAVAAVTGAKPAAPPTLEDAVTFIRIQNIASQNRAVAAVSPDGRHFAAVTWAGDLARDQNMYRLLIFDVAAGRIQPPREIARLPLLLAGNSSDREASPFSDLIFARDNRTILYLGRDRNGIAQIFSIDIHTSAVRQLTASTQPVRSFVPGPRGEVLAYSMLNQDPAENERVRLREDGFFLWDQTAQSSMVNKYFSRIAGLLEPAFSQTRQYFLSREGAPTVIYDSMQAKPGSPPDLSDPRVGNWPLKDLHQELTFHGWGSFNGSGYGDYALLFPYALASNPVDPASWDFYRKYQDIPYARRVAARYGLVHLNTGKIEPFLDAPHPQFEDESSEPVFSPDGKWVAVFTLDPIDGVPSDREKAQRRLPRWVAVELATRRRVDIPAGPGWQVVAWTDLDGEMLVLQKGRQLARIVRHRNDSWGAMREVPSSQEMGNNYRVAVAGRLALAAIDTTREPPAFASVNLVTGAIERLGELNPQLQRFTLGTVEEFKWQSASGVSVEGFLIAPPDRSLSGRLPAIVVVGGWGLRDRPYLFDGAEQRNSVAVHTWANDGFAVIYMPRPDAKIPGPGGLNEGDQMVIAVEEAIAHYDKAGLIDRRRVGITGWSRAAFIVDHVLMHSSHRFAAASQADGGGVAYLDGMRPFTDAEIERLHAPLLLEAHRLSSLVGFASLADRLEAMQRPYDLFYLPRSAHDTVRPRERFNSLTVHRDWFRFWLQDYKDSDVTKGTRYQHWESLRARQGGEGTPPSSSAASQQDAKVTVH